MMQKVEAAHGKLMMAAFNARLKVSDLSMPVKGLGTLCASIEAR
jgi:hypothetical protein